MIQLSTVVHLIVTCVRNAIIERKKKNNIILRVKRNNNNTILQKTPTISTNRRNAECPNERQTERTIIAGDNPTDYNLGVYPLVYTPVLIVIIRNRRTDKNSVCNAIITQ